MNRRQIENRISTYIGALEIGANAPERIGAACCAGRLSATRRILARWQGGESVEALRSELNGELGFLQTAEAHLSPQAGQQIGRAIAELILCVSPIPL